jgi:hypothetical protein
MSRKKTPVALCLEDGIVLVKHTHDVDLATKLAKQAYAEGSDWSPGDILLSKPNVIWCRIINALPGSHAEDEGWSWSYAAAPGPNRGVFPAVEFLAAGVNPNSIGGAA